MGVQFTRIAIADVHSYAVDRGAELADRFRASLRAAGEHDVAPVGSWERLLVGPIPQITNGRVTYIFGADGSNAGWELSEAVHELRLRFMADFEEVADVVLVAWGDDYPPRVSTP